MSDYSDMTRDELDREYSPSSCAPDYLSVLARYRAESEEARAKLRCEIDMSYGSDPVETLHFFPAPHAPAPIHAFVHGGHWQESSKEDSCFAAPAMFEAGAAFVALGYGLAPGHNLDAMVASIRRGLCWLSDHAHELGSCPDLVFASGSSAGAHLLAMALTTTKDDEPATVAGACLMSGIYDLEPVRLSYVNDTMSINAATAFNNSPIHHLPLTTSNVIVSRGAAETNEYVRQHGSFVKALRTGGSPALDLIVPGRNHFDLPLDLGKPHTVLGQAVLEQMRLG